MTRHGMLYGCPRMVVDTGAGRYGAAVRTGQELVEAVAWQDGVTLSQFDAWILKNRDVVITVTCRKKQAEGMGNEVHYESSPEDDVNAKTVAEWAPGLVSQAEAAGLRKLDVFDNALEYLRQAAVTSGDPKMEHALNTVVTKYEEVACR